MREPDPIVHPCDLLLSLVLGTTAVLAVLPAWCGLGWGGTLVWLCYASIGLVVAMRYLWSR